MRAEEKEFNREPVQKSFKTSLIPGHLVHSNEEQTLQAVGCFVDPLGLKEVSQEEKSITKPQLNISVNLK
jgi:hypothetical protein